MCAQNIASKLGLQHRVPMRAQPHMQTKTSFSLLPTLCPLSVIPEHLYAAVVGIDYIDDIISIDK